MAKRTQRGSQFKKTSKNMKPKASDTRGFKIDNFGFSEIAIFKDGLMADVYQELCLMACATALVITMLCQIAMIRIKSGFVGNIDTTDTFKFWKARFYKTEDTLYVLAVGAVIKPVSYSDDSVSTEDELVALTQTFRNLRPYINTCTSRNVGRWREGFISRQFGLINSCPVTKPEIFGIDPERVINMKIEDVLGMISLPDSMVTPELVIDRIISTIGSETVNLSEPGLTQGETDSAIEKQIAAANGGNWYIRTGKDDGTMGPPASGEFTLEQITEHLTSLEFAKYKHAVSVGNRKVIAELYAKVRAAVKPNPPDQAPWATTDNAQGVEGAATPPQPSAAGITPPSLRPPSAGRKSASRKTDNSENK